MRASLYVAKSPCFSQLALNWWLIRHRHLSYFPQCIDHPKKLRSNFIILVRATSPHSIPTYLVLNTYNVAPAHAFPSTVPPLPHSALVNVFKIWLYHIPGAPHAASIIVIESSLLARETLIQLQNIIQNLPLKTRPGTNCETSGALGDRVYDGGSYIRGLLRNALGNNDCSDDREEHWAQGQVEPWCSFH